ncbi:5-carboxymethyl-2-hydroxymuconate isomerase [Streptomyces griseochromogenes]|uniref:Isomerase n=1 Tax=Streptomyces griseochromogenes TaxID=68214 RepID=A0A1B1B735_9ACTN|nr:isomerase [Streptomyces griseochromogenes]ANP54644.1 isomerase [Streptomyces griseochromogenes]MBP2048810.1 5-carboxymethyl-2-hydroxymuconate isomerase [Streptomyces griseochromogenes]
MPQITVDYTAGADSFDEEGLARALHEAVVEIAGAKPEACKTIFREGYAAYGYEDMDERHAIVRVTIGLLAGRGEDTKARLTETVLELLRKHVEPQDGVTLHGSAEVRELDPSYRKFDR